MSMLLEIESWSATFQSGTLNLLVYPLAHHVNSLIVGLLGWVLEAIFGDVGDGPDFFSEEQDSEDSEKRRKKKKGTKRKRDGRGHEEGTLSYDLKLDDVLDRTLEDGAKQHNLTAVNVRNILHVSAAWLGTGTGNAEADGSGA